MSVLRQRTSQRTKKLWVAGAIGALAMGVVSSSIFVYSLNYMKNHQSAQEASYLKTIKDDKDLLQKEEQTKTKVYVIAHDIAAGTLIKAADLADVELPKAAVPDNMITDKNYPAGKYAKIEIRKNTPLTKTMLYEEGVTPADMRYQELKIINLPSDLKQNQYVDVRIKFPTGQDYIVLSKKKVTQLQGGTVWFAMGEKEILLLSSAMVDAFLENATLYAVTYVDPYVQEQSMVDYPVNQKVQNLIISDPNILEQAKEGMETWARLNLENSLSQMDATAKLKVSAGASTKSPSDGSGAGATPGGNTAGSFGNTGQNGVSAAKGSTFDSSSGTYQHSNDPGQSKDSQKSIFEQNAGGTVSP